MIGFDKAKANFIVSLQRQIDEEIFIKSNQMIVVSSLMKRKIKKIFLENFGNKNFNIKFCFMKLSTTKILPNLQGTRQSGTG